MSLKAFHLVFMVAATALCFGCGVWGIRDYFSPQGHTGDLLFGIGALIVGGLLIVYERYFLRKLKNVGYL